MKWELYDEMKIGVVIGEKMIPADIILYETIGKLKIELRYDNKTLIEEATTYFEALILLREHLEKINHQIICKGACRNVYPSGMCLDMGYGDRAYSLTVGKPARMKDLVDIFDTCDPTDCVTIKEQKAFFEEWISNPRED